VDGAVCSGAGVGGGVAVVSVGGEAGSKYHIRKSATTMAAAMMSNLVRSIGFPFLQITLGVDLSSEFTNQRGSLREGAFYPEGTR